MCAQNVKAPIMVRNSEGFANALAVIVTMLTAPTFVSITSGFVKGIIAGSYSGEWAGWAMLAYKIAVFPMIFYFIRNLISTAMLSWSTRIALRMAQR